MSALLYPSRWFGLGVSKLPIFRTNFIFAFSKAVRQKSGFHFQGIQLKYWPCWQKINRIIKIWLSLFSLASFPVCSALIKFLFVLYSVRESVHRQLTRWLDAADQCAKISSGRYLLASKIVFKNPSETLEMEWAPVQVFSSIPCFPCTP